MVFDFECENGSRNKLILSLSSFGGLALLLSGYTISSSYLSVSGYGSWGVSGQELVVWFSLLGIAIMAVSLVVGLFFSKARCTSLAILLGSGLLVTMILISLKCADTIRMDGFHRLTQEAGPLITAINAYEKKNGHPPQSLKQLSTESLSRDNIKGGALPEFDYYPGPHAFERYHGNPWVLILQTPTGPLKWDMFLYYPLQNYPTLGLGGWFEKVDEWAYVHE